MGHLRSPQADDDLDGIWFFVAQRTGSFDSADGLIESITDRFALLAAHPYIGRARDQDLRAGLRTFPASEYVIVYRIEDEEVLILRVLRGSRDIEGLVGRSS